MKKTILTTLLALFILLCASFTARAQETVKVQLTPHYTEIESMSVYGPAVEFPVLTYKGITYLPMTYSLSARLGIAVGFTHEDGFFVTKYNDMIFAQSENDAPFGGDGNFFCFTDYTAVIPDYPVYINGVRYDSSKEDYPFLNFGGVTYLPLTYDIAYCELGLEVNLTDSGLFINRTEFTKTALSRGLTASGENLIFKQRNEFNEYTDEQGQPRRYLYGWWEIYRLDRNADFAYLTHIDTQVSLRNYPNMAYPAINRDGENVNIYTVEGTDGNKTLTYKGTPIDSIPESNDYFGREYIFEDVTFAFVNIFTNNITAPYTGHEERIYAVTEDGIKRLEWDARNNLSRIIPDGIGGYLLLSDSYSPFHVSRWSTPFSSVYRYRSDGTFSELTIPNLNSIFAYGVFDGKLLVKGMYYGADKNTSPGYLPISTVNSGFYSIDVATGEAQKLYPYVQGEAFTTDDGGFYCLTRGGARPRVVDLMTGENVE